jgi:hypothetical protein
MNLQTIQRELGCSLQFAEDIKDMVNKYHPEKPMNNDELQKISHEPLPDASIAARIVPESGKAKSTRSKRRTRPSVVFNDIQKLRRERRINTAPETWRKVLRDALDGKGSPRSAIKAQCGECNGFDRAAISTCTAVACPLWQFRPFQKS